MLEEDGVLQQILARPGHTQLMGAVVINIAAPMEWSHQALGWLAV